VSANLMAYPEQRHPYARTPIHHPGGTTVLYDGRRLNVDNLAVADSGQLWIDPAELNRILGFELKPEGACRDNQCIPLPAEIWAGQDGEGPFNLSAFADLIEQPYLHDAQHNVWSFGEIPAIRQDRLLNARVPDLTLTDRAGNTFNLADLKGKKALIVTWSSW